MLLEKNQNDIVEKNLGMENNLDVKTVPILPLSYLFPTYSCNLSPTQSSFKWKQKCYIGNLCTL